MTITQFLLIMMLFWQPDAVFEQSKGDYLDYHQAIIQIETQIGDEQLDLAIRGLDSLFQSYAFVFLRDCQLGTQLCAHEKDVDRGFQFLYRGIQQGWSLKSLKKDPHLAFFREKPAWEQVLLDYDSLHQMYLSKINQSLRAEVQSLFKKDQKKSLAAFLRIGQKAKVRYNEKKFAPHSEDQMRRLDAILDQYGYPGEQLIGNNWWASVILSHHNSISSEYNSQDTLFLYLKPKLLRALRRGEISPDHFASIQDWRTAVMNEHQLSSFGFLGEIPNASSLKQVDINRDQIGLRSISLRNRLIEVEQKTGMNLYLPKDWQEGKIERRP
ncbi:MAG: hypothetical protein AAFU64_08830 [Bacteroidota bacterium]